MAEAARSLEQQTESAGRSGSIEDLALIEEHVDSGLLALLENYEPKYRFDRLPVDSIPDRFSLQLNQPLPDLDTAGAKAYAATCHYMKDRSIYALVMDPRMPYRSVEIEAMKAISHPNLLTLHDALPVRLSQPAEMRMVLFMDRPRGTRLSDLIAAGKSFNEPYVVRSVLAPLCEALGALKEQNISHGRINPATVYIDDRLQLAECFSEPSGMSQPSLYEPIERALADPIGRGVATSKSDAYAIGMLAYELLFGLGKFREAEPTSYARYVAEVGSYHLLLGNKELNESLADFFRGTLNENREERWGLEQIRMWLGGKRYNLIHPSLPHESTRPFTFSEADYFNCRALANGIHRNWGRAAKDLRSAKLDRWLETSAHKAETAERIERIIRSTGGESSTNPRHNNELCSRTILTLDPAGPIRMDKVALNVDGLGAAISHYLKSGQQQELAYINDIVEFDLITYWSDVYGGEKSSAASNIIWKLQSVRSHIKNASVGFGMERLLYNLNPSLPCQSELLLPYHTTTIEEALSVLDALAQKKGKDTSLLDRHLAAFLSSRIDMNKEIKFQQLARFPLLRDNPELKCLRILSLAQEKAGKAKLPGLSAWVAIRIERLLENIHNRRSRKQLKQKLKSAANTGIISYVLAVLVESDITQDDYQGFAKAAYVYSRNMERMSALENPKTADKMSQDLGRRIAVFVAYLVLSITVYVLVDQYYVGFGG